LSKSRFFGLHFVVDDLGLPSINLTWLAIKANAFSEITQNNGHHAVQGHQFWYQSNDRVLFFINR